MASRMVKDARAVFHAAPLWIVSGIVKTPDPRQRDRLRAHGAWLEGDIEITALKSFVPQYLASNSDCQHFGVGRRVLQFENPVARLGNDFTVRRSDDSTDWNLAAFACFHRRLKGRPHKLIRLDHGSGQHMVLA